MKAIFVLLLFIFVLVLSCGCSKKWETVQDCQSEKDITKRNLCFSQIADAKGDKSICNEITDELQRNDCKYQVIAKHW
jgi:hypothetical protein